MWIQKVIILYHPESSEGNNDQFTVIWKPLKVNGQDI